MNSETATNVKLWILGDESLSTPTSGSGSGTGGETGSQAGSSDPGAGWSLVVSQTDAANNLFPEDVRSTFVYNENDSTANPFMSLGALDWEAYRLSDGTFQFKVEWSGGQSDLIRLSGSRPRSQRRRTRSAATTILVQLLPAKAAVPASKVLREATAPAV